MSIKAEKEKGFQQYKEDKKAFNKKIIIRKKNLKENTRKSFQKRKTISIDGKEYSADGYRLLPNGECLHRKTSEMEDGKIPNDWHVHHCDFNKLNNGIDNLIQIPKELHEMIHRNKDKSPKCQLLKLRKSFLEIKKNDEIKLIEKEITRLNSRLFFLKSTSSKEIVG